MEQIVRKFASVSKSGIKCQRLEGKVAIVTASTQGYVFFLNYFVIIFFKKYYKLSINIKFLYLKELVIPWPEDWPKKELKFL